ncbi:MAG: hypothetical protein ACPGXI_17965, partial [Mycobacterium sp.]
MPSLLRSTAKRFSAAVRVAVSYFSSPLNLPVSSRTQPYWFSPLVSRTRRLPVSSMAAEISVDPPRLSGTAP